MEAESIVKQAGGREAPRGANGVDLRVQLHAMWDAVAPSWSEHAEYVDARGAHVTDELLRRSQPRPGMRALELACGPGSVGIAAAALVGSGGEVVVSDVAPEMTAIAARRAAALGLGNVSARALDLEDIDEPDECYDVVLCREGLMFATDPARAAREIRRVLKPGGHVALAVWGPRDRNPWLGLVFDAVSSQTGAPVPPPGVPGPFSLGDAHLVESLLTEAGLLDVLVTELPTPLRAASFDDWWARTSALAGPLRKVVASLPDASIQALNAQLRVAVEPYITAAGVEIPGVALIASARR